MSNQPIVNDQEVWLSEPQDAVLASRAAVILDMAGQGSGKSQNIGYSSGMMVSDFPQLQGFIGANTNMQLSQSTLANVFKTWRRDFGFTEYEKKFNPGGAYVIDKIPPPHFKKTIHLKYYEATISFWNGALIFLGSLENYKAHEGKEFAWAHLDETKDTKESALKEVIIARLRQYGLWYDREGTILFDDEKISPDEAAVRGWTAWNPITIHTSPALDGVQWLNDMFKLDKFEKQIKEKVTRGNKSFFNVKFDNKEVIIYPVHFNAQNLPPNYIENQIANLIDEDKILKMVCGFPFGKSGGEYFPHFRKDRHVYPVQYVPSMDMPVHMTWDFNTVPYMTCVLAQLQYKMRYVDQVGQKHDVPQIGYKAQEVMQIRFYKEYCFESPLNSTDAVCEQFIADHDPATCEVFYYGDANGNHRIPGMGAYTNFKGIVDKLWAFVHSSSKRVGMINVAPLKRRDLVNRILYGKYPEIEIIFDPEGCPKTILDFENVKQGKDGTKHKEKVTENGITFEKYGHTSDAVEYMVAELCKNYLFE